MGSGFRRVQRFLLLVSVMSTKREIYGPWPTARGWSFKGWTPHNRLLRQLTRSTPVGEIKLFGSQLELPINFR